jgi:hypothetical protein
MIFFWCLLCWYSLCLSALQSLGRTILFPWSLVRRYVYTEDVSIAERLNRLDEMMRKLLLVHMHENLVQDDTIRELRHTLEHLHMELDKHLKCARQEMRHGFGRLAGNPIRIHADLEGNAGSIIIHHANEIQQIKVQCAPVYFGSGGDISHNTE